MATQLESAPLVPNASQPPNQPSTQELGMKERFYRHFQDEVIGIAK
jgi:hypothetical protein